MRRPACPPAVPLVPSQTETAEPFSPCDGGRKEGWNERKKKQAGATQPGLLLISSSPSAARAQTLPLLTLPLQAGSRLCPRLGHWYPGLHLCPPSSHTSPQPPPRIQEVSSPLPCSALPHHTHTHTHTSVSMLASLPAWYFLFPPVLPILPPQALSSLTSFSLMMLQSELQDHKRPNPSSGLPLPHLPAG